MAKWTVDNDKPFIGDIEITSAARDEIARILEQVAQDGLPHPRHLDSAIDAILQAVCNG